MSENRPEEVYKGALPLELDEKSLLGSSYSYQQGTAQASGVTANDMDKSDDD